MVRGRGGASKLQRVGQNGGSREIVIDLTLVERQYLGALHESRRGCVNWRSIENCFSNSKEDLYACLRNDHAFGVVGGGLRAGTGRYQPRIGNCGQLYQCS